MARVSEGSRTVWSSGVRVNVPERITHHQDGFVLRRGGVRLLTLAKCFTADSEAPGDAIFSMSGADEHLA